MLEQRTMQQWADFTGCYVAVDSDGSVWAYEQEPELDGLGDWTYAGSGVLLGISACGMRIDSADYESHDYKQLVIPGNGVFAQRNTVTTKGGVHG